jgi:dihydropyrimidinase
MTAMAFDTLMCNATVVFPNAEAARVDVAIRDGAIAALLAPDSGVQARDVIDLTGKHLFPGLIDAHVHFGFGEPITEYSTETVYAAQGGFTTVIGYFLNNEDYADVFDREIAYAGPRAHIDYAFHFCTASEEHLRRLADYVRDYGVTSFKYFMNFRGEEGRYLGLDGTDDGYLYELLRESADIGGVTVVLHTENIELVNRIRREFQLAGRSSLRDWSLSKPDFTEAENVIRAMYFAEHHGATIYVPHLSTRMALDEVRRWRDRYDRVRVETCPHYLTHTLDAEDGSIGKANPPFRTQDDVDAMWDGLADGSIDVVASDHVPRKRATKDKPIWQASQGFPGTATILPVLLHEGYHKGRLSLRRIAQVLTSAPARIFQLHDKGDIRVSLDADLTVVDLGLTREVRASELGSYADYSLYDGRRLAGWPTLTMVRGEIVMRDGKIVGPPGHGRYIRRPFVDGGVVQIPENEGWTRA